MSTPTKDDGGSAFPGGIVYDPRRESMEHMGAFMDLGGMSRRDWFAGMALPAIVAGSTELCKLGGKAPEVARLAQDCYKLADAMIAESKRL